jgi:Xaa-Pro aminopeptidase
LYQTMEVIAPGVTERQLEAYLTWRLLENGAENGIFGIVMASGPNSALPHAVPTDRKLERGDLLLIDFGALYDGYYSDITRTVAIGQIDEEMQKVYQLVLAANENAIAAAKPGIWGGEVDAVARTTIKEAGYGDYFGHGLGHGVGLEIHEKPMLRQNSQARLQRGNVITVEPGIYLPGRFGVRIEDLLTVTENGCRNLTAMSKELVIL